MHSWVKDVKAKLPNSLLLSYSRALQHSHDICWSRRGKPQGPQSLQIRTWHRLIHMRSSQVLHRHVFLQKRRMVYLKKMMINIRFSGYPVYPNFIQTFTMSCVPSWLSRTHPGALPAFLAQDLLLSEPRACMAGENRGTMWPHNPWNPESLELAAYTNTIKCHQMPKICDRSN